MEFCDFHPIVSLAFFAMAIGFSMIFTHPLALGVSLFGAVCFYIRLRGFRGAGFLVKLALPAALITAAINALFNHRGETILAKLPNGSPITLESLLYGLSAAAMMAAVLIWFACFSVVMTSDKLTYLFGRLAPSLSLVLCMTLRFVPRFIEQFERVREARQFAGDSEKGKIRKAFECFSAMTLWSLEGSADTADSMKARGFGLRGRTAFAVYRVTPRDACALIWLAACAALVITAAALGCFKWEYFPSVGGKLPEEPLSYAALGAYLAAALTPIWVDIWVRVRWGAAR